MDQFTLKLNLVKSKHMKRKDGTFPVRLGIYNKNNFQKQYLVTPFSFKTKEEFLEVYEWQEVRKNKTKADWEIEKQIRPLKEQMDQFLEDAIHKARTLAIFNFPEFKALMARPKYHLGDSLRALYDNKINDFTADNRVGTASNYESSIRSLEEFWRKERKSEPLRVDHVNVAFLNSYERYMKASGKSSTTIGIYLRPLRSILNDYTGNLIYPFHNKNNKSGYVIPTAQKSNKALTKAELKRLFDSEPLNEDQQKAKDFWFFSYLSYGMNMKDIAKLRQKDITGGKFSFIRSKTELTTKGKLITIEVALQDFHKEVIAKYGNKGKSMYVFPILKASMTAQEQKTAYQAFTRYVNTHIKKLAEIAQVPTEISTNWARHSFASKLDKEHVSLEFIRQALGHQKITTTQNYLSSFDDESTNEITNKLLDF